MVLAEKTAVGTVFIASAAAYQLGWASHPPGIIGFGGRDKDGPYGGMHPGCKKMMRIPKEDFYEADKEGCSTYYTG